MSDLHLVVDFRAVADRSRAVGTAIDRCAGADFYVATNANVTELSGEYVLPGDEKAKTEGKGS